MHFKIGNSREGVDKHIPSLWCNFFRLKCAIAYSARMSEKRLGTEAYTVLASNVLTQFQSVYYNSS